MLGYFLTGNRIVRKLLLMFSSMREEKPKVLLVFLLIKRQNQENHCLRIEETIAVCWNAISREPVLTKQLMWRRKYDDVYLEFA